MNRPATLLREHVALFETVDILLNQVVNPAPGRVFRRKRENSLISIIRQYRDRSLYLFLI